MCKSIAGSIPVLTATKKVKMVIININCKYNDRRAWCKNKNIKRSLFGMGARCCVIYPNCFDYCKYQKKYPKPKYSTPPPPPPKRIKMLNEDKFSPENVKWRVTHKECPARSGNIKEKGDKCTLYTEISSDGHQIPIIKKYCTKQNCILNYFKNTQKKETNFF